MNLRTRAPSAAVSAITRTLIAGGTVAAIGWASLGTAAAQSAPTATAAASPSVSPSASPSASPTASPSATASRTPTASPTASPRATSTAAPRATAQPGQRGQRGQPAQRAQALEKFLETLASKLGVSKEKLLQALQDTRRELGQRGLPGIPGRPGAQGTPGPRKEDLPRLQLAKGFAETAAQAIGITPQQLRQELPGKSLTDVARAHNVDPKKVSDALKATASQQIDQRATGGRAAIPADRVAQLKQRAAQQIDQLMTRTMPTGRTR